VAMWRLGLFFHEMGFGLLSVFLPLYVVSIRNGDGLFWVGVMVSIALFAAIPASFFWGYLCDKTRHYKRFILLAFLVSAIMLCLFTFTKDIVLLTVLYAVMSIFHAAHEAPKNILISELYSHHEWKKNFAFYEGFTEVGSLIGLVLGFFASAYGFGSTNTLFLVAGLNFIAFILSAILVVDPDFIFERRLVNLERTVGFASHGVLLASKMMQGLALDERLKKENVTAFCCGLVLFSLATNILFTPLPIFASADLKLSAAVVFAIFVLNSGGSIVGYALVGRTSEESNGKASMSRLVLFRALLAFLLLAALRQSSFDMFLTIGVVIFMGLAFAVFIVNIEHFSMELIPAGKAGSMNVLIGVGSAVGSFVGPFIAQALGFFHVFVITGVIFLMAFVFFKLFA
jgi:MFS family permease